MSFKFRAWNKLTRQLQYNDELVKFTLCNSIHELLEPMMFFDTDKHGKEMYEHDIISIHRFLFDGSEYENEITGILKRDKFGFFIAITKPHEITKYMGFADDEVKEIAVYLSELGLHEESFTKLGDMYHNSDLLS